MENRFLMEDIVANNGLLHVVDHVILPLSKEKVTDWIDLNAIIP